MSDTPTQPESSPPTIRGKLYAAISVLIAAISGAAAFLPGGYGFVTAFLATGGVIFGGKAARYGAPRAGRWASRANMVPVLLYALYMFTHMPTSNSQHSFEATVLEAGILADQDVFHKKVRAAGPIAGVRMAAQPCGHEFVVRVTSAPNSHLGIYVPSEEVRQCLSQFKEGDKLTLSVLSNDRTIGGAVKGFLIPKVGDCQLEGADQGAVVRGTACPGWF
jgi:hypothetical protein